MMAIQALAMTMNLATAGHDESKGDTPADQMKVRRGPLTDH